MGRAVARHPDRRVLSDRVYARAADRKADAGAVFDRIDYGVTGGAGRADRGQSGADSEPDSAGARPEELSAHPAGALAHAVL